VRATDTITVKPIESGTRVTYNAEFEFKGLTRFVAPLMSPVLGRAFKKLGDEAEAGMRAALDAL
jgi:hypothetical protein